MNAFQYWLRQARQPSLRLLLLAVTLAVAAIASVGIFSARLEAALARDAANLMGGDLVIESKRPVIGQPWYDELLKLQRPYSEKVKDPDGLVLAQSVVFPSVIPSSNTDLLVALKAVSPNYPLKGSLKLQDEHSQELDARAGPPQGEAWVDAGVLGSLGIGLGDFIPVGTLSLKVSKVILLEPDRGGGFINFAPRVMIHIDDLQTAGLLGPGSRASWRVYLAGRDQTISNIAQQWPSKFKAGESLETVAKGRPEVNGTLTRARDFLSMAALIGTLVACVGIGLVAHVFAREQTAELAVMKSLGYTPRQLSILWLKGLLLLTFTGGLAGIALGAIAHGVLVAMLAGLLGVTLPVAGFEYLIIGPALAALLLAGFAGAPAWFALRAPAVSVIRRQDAARSKSLAVVASMVGVTTALGLCLLMVTNTKLGLFLFLGFTATALIFALLFWSLLRLLGAVGSLSNKSGIRIIKNMTRRASALTLQGVSLALGLSALLMLAVVQGDLIERWQQVVPEKAPNQFVFNIQPDQVDAVSQTLTEYTPESVKLYPMVRGRMIEINGQAINAETFDNDRARAMVDREFNLSFSDELPKHNRIESGQWFSPNTERAEISIETSVAERLKLKLGDKVTFDIAGAKVGAEVTSIRDLRWDSMEVNFYIIFPVSVLKDFPQTWITAVYAEPSKANEMGRKLVRQFPNLTVLDTDIVVGQIRKILAQVSRAVQFVFVFTIAAGGLVLVACVLSGARQRSREAAIYRAMGASGRQLQRAALLELAILGGLAGLVAAVVAQASGWAIAKFVFEFEYAGSISLTSAGIVFGCAVSIGFGIRSINRVVKAPVVQTLRQLGV